MTPATALPFKFGVAPHDQQGYFRLCQCATAKDVAFTVKPSSGYAVDDITLKIGTKSNTVSAGASYIRVNGVDYNMTRNSNGNVTVYVDSIKNNVTISATAVKSSSVVSRPPVMDANGRIYIAPFG